MTATLETLGGRPITACPMSDVQASYLAGLVDGEGYVGITVARGSKSALTTIGRESHRLNVSVRMTDVAPLHRSADWTGFGSVKAKTAAAAHHRPVHEWTIWSRQAASVLLALLPWLCVKDGQARLALEFQALMRMPGSNGLTEHEWGERRRLATAIRRLNYGSENVR